MQPAPTVRYQSFLCGSTTQILMDAAVSGGIRMPVSVYKSGGNLLLHGKHLVFDSRQVCLCV